MSYSFCSLNSLLLFVPLIFFVGCSTSSTQDRILLLEGRWEIARALRNNREAASLSDLYFDIGPEARFETNISGTAAVGSYELNEDEIITTALPMSLTYSIVALTDSSLQLKTQVSNYRFEFLLRRSTDESVETPAS